MKETSLKFPSILALVDFILAVDVVKYQLDKAELLLISKLSEKEVELATNGFKASVIHLEAA